MPVMEGTTELKTWVGSYSFAVDGGGTGTYVLRSNHGPIPIGSMVVGGVLDITGACLSASGTMALQVEGAGDMLAASLQAALGAGVKDIVPDATGSTAVKTTASRAPSLVIAIAAFTAGIFTLTLFYK